MATVAELVAQVAKAVFCEAEFIEDVWVIDPQLWERRIAHLTELMLQDIESFIWIRYITMAPEGQAEEREREIAQVRQQARDTPGSRIEHMQRLYEQYIPDWEAFTRQYLATARESWVKIARGLA